MGLDMKITTLQIQRIIADALSEAGYDVAALIDKKTINVGKYDTKQIFKIIIEE